MSKENDELDSIEHNRERNEEIGRRLAAAYMSYSLGVSVGYAYQKHTKNGPIGSFWVNSAIIITKMLMEAQENPTQKPEVGRVENAMVSGRVM